MRSRYSGIGATRRDFAITVMPMPKLSPTQCAEGVTTTLQKWHVHENMYVDAYAVVCEVETDALTGDGSDDIHQLDIEVQEECFVARLLCKEGDQIKAGFPIAICCDDEDELELARSDGFLDFGKDAYLQSDYSLTGLQSYTKTVRKSGNS